MVITVNADAVTALRVAYEVMLSLGTIKSFPCEPLIDENLLFARALIKPNIIGRERSLVIMNVTPLSPDLSELTIYADSWREGGRVSPKSVLFITDILSGISQLIPAKNNYPDQEKV